METDTLLEVFFEKVFENEVSDNSLEYAYSFPQDKVLKYIDEICAIDYSEFIAYINNHPYMGPICTEDITQASSFESYTDEFCKALLDDGDKGYTFLQIGKLLQNDGVVRTKLADTKYGENHSKAALQLGLAYKLYDYIYLSCLGRVYNLLNQNLQHSLLARTILRNKLYARIMHNALQGPVDIAEYLECLSPSTKVRRGGDVMRLVQICQNQCEKEDVETYPIYSSLKKEKVKNQKTKSTDNKNTSLSIDFGKEDKDDPIMNTPIAADSDKAELGMHQKKELLFSKCIDWSLFVNGTAVPKSVRDKIASAIAPGGYMPITIRLGNVDYDARLIKTLNEKDVQILYSSNRDLINKLQQVFATSYEKVRIKKSESLSHVPVKSPNETISVYTTDDPTLFIFECHADYTKSNNSLESKATISDGQIDIIHQAWSFGKDVWSNLVVWGDKYRFFENGERNFICSLNIKKVSGKVFTLDQAERAMSILERAKVGGFCANDGESSRDKGQNEALEKYKKLFTILNVSRNGENKAPHKPILLITVLELIQSGFIKNNEIQYTNLFVSEFKANWKSLVSIDVPYTPQPLTPFKHMSGEPFWHLVSSRNEDIQNWHGQLSKNLIEEYDIFAKFDDELFELAQDENSNKALRQVLIEKYLQTKKEDSAKWLFPYNPQKYDLEGCLEKYGRVFWTLHVSLKSGDVVYIYCSSPVQSITYKMLVEDTDVPYDRVDDDREFYLERLSAKEKSELRYCKLTVLNKYSEHQLDLPQLRVHGLKWAPQGQMYMPDNLIDYVSKFE